MNNLILGLAFAVLAGVAVLFAAIQGPAAAESAEQQVRALSDQEGQAFLHQDRAALARLWSNDLVVTNPLNQLATKQQVLGMVDSGFLVITSFERKIEYTHTYGDTVVLAGSETVLWGGRMPLAGRTQQLRFTAVWMRQDGRFQQVLRHANVIPQ